MLVLVGALAVTGMLSRIRDLIPGASASTPTYQTVAVSRGATCVQSSQSSGSRI